ncbi:MAG: hypothetical protein J3Q66DRAFT_309130 [Benniella sp.]|nr:MAG: hypothetical protein J3Q66DRAFT_309130 [Benniella sp.]
MEAEYEFSPSFLLFYRRHNRLLFFPHQIPVSHILSVVDMEERSLDERKLQEFYLHSPVNSLSTPETLTIPARWDAEAGCHVVLLDDVQVIFKDAHYVAENGCTIPFMKDNDSQELIPLRIKYRQGAILEIVADAADTLLAHIKRYEPYIESMMSRQETGMSGPHDSIEKLTESTSQGVSDDKKQVLQMKELVDGWASREQKDQEAQSNRQEMEQHMLEKQQQILQDQQRNIDRLAAIQERIQDTMALTLSARVQPFPRLFIVLPTQFSIWLNPVKFSLFFLCEPSHSSTSIHLARHKGYEIRDVEKFFQIYTPYIMSMTYILKNGIASPGLNIPCLSHLTLAEDVSEVQDVLSLKNNTIPSLMNDTISYIRDMTPYIRGIASNASVTRMNSQVALDVLESTVIDSATNYLVGFLEQEQTLGNMNQVITPDVVRWVCAEHFTDRQCEVVEDYQAEDADEEEHKNTIDDKGQWSLDELAKVAEPHGSQDIAREKAGATLGGKVGQESSTHEEFIRKFVLRHSNAKQTAPFAYNAESIAWTAREKEIAALGGEVEQRPTALQELIRAVSDSHENVRETAVRVLRGPSKVSRTALEAVIKAANDSHWNVQEAALQVLADQSQLSEGLVTVLIHNAGYGNVTVTRAAKAALIKHASSGPICQQLVHILLNGAISAQMVAIEVLATLVKLPESAIEALITTLETLEDNDRDFSSPAVHALLCQSELPESAIQSLVMVAKEGTLGASQAAIRVLESQILVSGPVIPALIECLKDESEHVRRTVVQGLRDDHKLPQSTVQQLMEVLSHGHVEIRETSTEILGGQVTLSEATMQALIKSPNNDPIVKDASVQGSGSQVERPQSEIGALVGILKDREKAVASSLLDIFKALKEQETEPVTLEELRRQRTKILQRTVVKSCKMIDFKDVTDIQRLTPRGQSRIQTAEWSCLRVVLKGVRPDSKEGVERFDQELEILKRVHDYDFIVPFYGVTTDPRTNVRYIVKKYCSNGNLTSFLESHHHDLTWLERYRICIDVVKGLEFLHKSGFYHRNLHSGNILLDDKRTAMLCDFGLSRSSSRYQTTEDSATVGLVTFMAPERLFTQRPVYAASCDIYSLGLIFWHISSGHIPFASEMGSTALLRGLTKGRREEIVPGTPREFQDLIVKCWDKRPSRRLKIRVVITILQALIARPSEPVNWILSVNARLSERALTAHPVPPDLDKIKNLEQAPNMLNRMVFDIQDPVMKETADYIESKCQFLIDQCFQDVVRN